MIEIKKDFIRKSKYSRPKRKLKSVKGIVFHWVANPTQSAKGVRNYFDMKSKETFSSAHFCVDDNEIIQALPTDELAYHVGSRAYNEKVLKRIETNYPNDSLIGIELCHNDWSGKFTKETLENAIELGAYLVNKFQIKLNCIFRHYDITFKNCPKFFVENGYEWNEFYKEIIKRASKL